MEIILEQFIPSDRPKRISNILKNIAIVFGAVAIMYYFWVAYNWNSSCNSSFSIFCWKLFNVCGL